MGLFDINYFTKVRELMPPDKRDKVILGFLQAFVFPVQYLRNKFLGNYRTGSFYAQYVPSVPYYQGQKVVYKQVVYESLVDGNTDNPPSDKWQVYLPSFIGVDTRVLFNGRLVTLTYALNDYYRSNFRQPLLLGWASTADSTHSLYSDIYIVNLPTGIGGFNVGQTIGSYVAQHDISSYSSWTAGSYSLGALVVRYGHLYLSLANSNTDQPPSANWQITDTVAKGFVTNRVANFTIYFPTALFATTNESEVRKFVDGLIPKGLFYTISIY